MREGLDRVIERQFRIALEVADVEPEGQAAAVHETRKALKRLRALLRLVRDSISLDRYHTDNAMLKLIAAELSPVRDTWVMAEVLDRLLPHDPDTSAAVATLIARLQERYLAESRALLENQAQMTSIIDQLEQVRDRSSRWSVLHGEQDEPLPHEFASIALGLQRVYKRGRRGMRIISDSPTDTLLHVWRKRAKYLRHQVEALNVLDPENLLLIEQKLEHLTDLLGDDHDLAMLLARFNNDPALVADIAMDAVVDAVLLKRLQLQGEAIDLGRTFFEDPSTDFLVYVEQLWKDGPTF